jgi:excisionase family DNA binding protein
MMNECTYKVLEPAELGRLLGSKTKRLLRLPEAATYLALAKWTVRQMALRGELKYIRRTEGGPLLFDIADLDAWIEQQKQ